jgi:TPP-dependent pyruvate/acetoin dehydrogenase alpha subunit
MVQEHLMKKPPISKDMLLEMVQRMWSIRLFEEAAGKLYKQGVIKGGIHASIGQEAVSTGVAFAMQPGDWFSSTHRGHAHHIAAGADLNKMLAEIRAKETGYCKGRGGSMHIAAFDVGSLGAYPLVAGGVPIAVGAALSEQLQGSARVVVAYFGDGALGQGTIFESFNLAVVWNLPVVFICENNQLAVATSFEESCSIRDFELLGRVFQMPGISVDGQDVHAVYRAAADAVDRARSGKGPSFINCNTHRFEGHYFGEPQLYRTRDVVEDLRKNRDPIMLLEHYLLERKFASQEELLQIRDLKSSEIESALDFAANSPDPAPDTYMENIYA